MKKSLFLAAFLLVTAMSFANVVKDKLYPSVNNVSITSVQKSEDTFKIEDSCSASCWGDIYYNGEYKTSVFASATAGDCVTAQTDCLQKANAKAQKYMAEAESQQ